MLCGRRGRGACLPTRSPPTRAAISQARRALQGWVVVMVELLCCERRVGTSGVNVWPQWPRRRCGRARAVTGRHTGGAGPGGLPGCSPGCSRAPTGPRRANVVDHTSLEKESGHDADDVPGQRRREPAPPGLPTGLAGQPRRRRDDRRVGADRDRRGTGGGPDDPGVRAERCTTTRSSPTSATTPTTTSSRTTRRSCGATRSAAWSSSASTRRAKRPASSSTTGH